MNTYEVGGQRFEFVVGSDILHRLTHSPSTYSRIVGKSELFGVEVAALRDLSILGQLELKDEYAFSWKDKKTLTDVAYLRYRRAQLVPLQSVI